MPTELRRIEFSEIELRDALALYQARLEGGSANEGRVSAIKITGGNEFNIVAKVNCSESGDIVRKVFDHATTVAVMVVYSKSVGIPLPRDGAKVLAPTNFGGVALNIRYEHEVKLDGFAAAMLAQKSSAGQVSGHA